MKSSVLGKISRELPYMNPALYKIGNYILKNPDIVKSKTIKDLAIDCEVAESTITRFVKEIGFTNYRELKYALVENLIIKEQIADNTENKFEYVYENITADDNYDEIIRKITNKNINTLSQTQEMIHTDKIEQAVGMIEKAETLIFSCMGSSVIAAQEAQMRFTRAGKQTILNRDESIQLMNASISNETNLLIGLSNSGKTKVVIDSLRIAKQNNTPTIAITSFENSPICSHADLVLFTSTKTAEVPTAFDWESTTSKFSQILLIDILYACYAIRNFETTKMNMDKSYKALINTRKSPLL